MANVGYGYGGFAAGMPTPAVGSIAGNNAMLQEAQQAGLFSPFGSPRLQALARRRALFLSGIQRQRAGGYGQLVGLDPMAQRQALTQADIAGNQGLVGALNAADQQQAAANQQFFRNLYMNQLGYNQQLALAKQQQKAQRSAGLGSMLGQLGGAALGFLGGGPFGAAAGFLGASKAGGNQAYDFGDYMSQNPYGGYYGIGG